MCGITGWVGFARDLRTERSILDEMTETMACRGPDDGGSWTSEHAGLGHRRLAVIDIAGGRQPMRVDTAGGPVVLVYSGETYNFTELRDELSAQGQRFTTSSDTEVVLRGYLVWGKALADHLVGMYAFAIWDDRTHELVMIRDRLGIKPFYYYPTRDGVLFGSEPKAILANPLAEPVMGISGLRELFAYIKTPGHGIWEGMYEVRPGTVVTVDASGIRTHVYWSLETRPHADDQQASIATVRELLEGIVRQQLVADVPRCVLLSGGLDSSTLTAIAAKQLAERDETIRSFAVDFVGAENFVSGRPQMSQDAPFAYEVADRWATEHESIVFGYAELADPDIRAKVVGSRDLPIGLGDVDTSLYLLFEAIRRQSTVALSGESADELFGGYTQFFDSEAQHAEMFPWLAHFSDQLVEESNQLTAAFDRALDLGPFLRDSYHTAVAEIARLEGETDDEYRMRKVCYLHVTRFVRQLLDRKDRISMAVGLEVRVPYCDHRLVEYVYNTPWAIKAYDGREKSLLRGAATDLLPTSVLDRVKSGYPATQDPKYVELLQEQGKELLARRSHQVFEFFEREWLRYAAYVEPEQLPHLSRRGLERALDFALWLDLYRPTVRFG